MVETLLGLLPRSARVASSQQRTECSAAVPAASAPRLDGCSRGWACPLEQRLAAGTAALRGRHCTLCQYSSEPDEIQGV